MMSRERGESTEAAADDVTVRLDQMRSSQRSAAATGVLSPTADQKAKGGRWIRGPWPKWIWPAAAALGLIFILLLPLLFYSQPGFTLVVRGAPPASQVFIDGVPRGIPGVEQSGDNLIALIRTQGLKAGVSHGVRLNCGGGQDATLYLDNDSSVGEVLAQDGDVVNLRVKCDAATDEIEYTGKMRLVMVGAGAFWMGDDSGEENERPAHLVTTLNYDYYIDKFEVTNQQYKEFASKAGLQPPAEPHWDAAYSVNSPDHPVVGVSWNDARRYCEQLGKRLPTEAEWEKAASWDPKATDDSLKWKRRWPWGNDFDPSRSNFSSEHTQPVTRFAAGASAYGVYNMAGNAGEWVEDLYRAYPGSQARDADFNSQKRVIRGGTFRSFKGEYERTTIRFSEQPILSQEQLAKRSWLIGFRCAVRRDDPALQRNLKKNGQ